MATTCFRKKECDKCHREITVINFSKHYNACNGKQNISVETYKTSSGYKCPECNKIFKKLGIKNHIWREHTSDGLKYKLNFKNYNCFAWNKGLSKETNESVKKQGETLSTRYETGELISTWKGKKHTNESKKKLSDSRIKFLLENPDKVPYIINHSSRPSYPEIVFENALNDASIIGWIKNYRSGLYAYDFGFEDLKIDVEVDGSTHKQEKVIKIDKRRDKFSIENGWCVLRFESNLVKKNPIFCINILKRIIEFRTNNINSYTKLLKFNSTSQNGYGTIF